MCKMPKNRFGEYVSSLEVYRLEAKETNRQNREESKWQGSTRKQGSQPSNR